MQTDFSKIRCIAFDLDFTVLTTEKTVSERTKAAFAKAQERGIALLPVSGRAFPTFPDDIRGLSGADYMVASNGASVYDARSGEKIHEWLLKAADVRRIMRSVGNFFLEGQITYEVCMDGVIHAAADYVRDPARFGMMRSAVPYIQQTRKPERYIIDFIFENAGRLAGLDLILKDSGLYRMIGNTIRRNVENIHITSSIPCRLEISSGEAGKASGMRYALGLLGISPEETMAFGDGDNDADMLQAAGIGVALKNATETCKESADCVTEYTADEDGVAKFLEETVL
ncbi:MAG: HAD hydrolase family protein [Clostridiales bacterium]|nr:HAD hydrolase family protein [Clostridiales bacterium]